MTTFIINPERTAMSAAETEVRLDCLRLAVSAGAGQQAVKLAQDFHAFATGESDDPRTIREKVLDALNSAGVD